MEACTLEIPPPFRKICPGCKELCLALYILPDEWKVGKCTGECKKPYCEWETGSPLSPEMIQIMHLWDCFGKVSVGQDRSISRLEERVHGYM